MRVRLTGHNEVPEIIEFQKAKPSILGPVTFDLPQWYETYTEQEQIEILDYIGNIDGDTVNVIEVEAGDNKGENKYCLIYSTQAEAKTAFDTLLRCGLLDTERTIAWSKVAKTGGYDSLYFPSEKKRCSI